MKITYVNTVVVGCVLYWLYLCLKATKDPDVIAASDLRMSVSRYRLYRSLYDEMQNMYKKHGTSSESMEDFFRTQIFPKIKNQNEWRRYNNFRMKKCVENKQNELEEMKAK